MKEVIISSPFFTLNFLSPVYEAKQELNSAQTKMITKNTLTHEYTIEKFNFDIRYVQIAFYHDYKLDMMKGGKVDEYHVTMVELTNGAILLSPLTVEKFGREEIPRYIATDDFYNFTPQ